MGIALNEAANMLISKKLWLGIILPLLSLLIYIPWRDLGVRGTVFPILFLVSIWLVVEACNFVRKNSSTFTALQSFIQLRVFEEFLLSRLILVWSFILINFAVCYLIFSEPLGVHVERHWIEYKSNLLIEFTVARFFPFLLIASGLVVGFNLDTLRSNRNAF
jgi:hypothetical protein